MCGIEGGIGCIELCGYLLESVGCSVSTCEMMRNKNAIATMFGLRINVVHKLFQANWPPLS